MNEGIPTWMERVMNGEYVEEYELRRYVWRNYRHVFSERELALRFSATIELKARHARSDAAAARYRQMPGYFIDADVEVIAASGSLTAFEQQCCERLLHDHREEIFINRCERCQHIVASPIACTCRWCGHIWFDRRAEMKARSTSSIYPNPRDKMPGN